MKMKLGIQSIGYSVLAGLTAMTMASSANAAKVSLNTSYEVGDYGSGDAYNYAGPRVDLTMNPDGSNWYFDLGVRKRNHDSGQTYSRTDMGASYRFRFANGWVQPGVKVRRDETLYNSDSAGRLINDQYSLELTHILALRGNWGLWGDWSFNMTKETNESAKGGALETIHSDGYGWEIEQGVRYYLSNVSHMTVSLYDMGVLQDKGDMWGTGGSRGTTQIRGYYSHRFANGLSIQPYVRIPVGYGYRDKWYETAADQESKTTRYALQMNYPITDAIRINGEYYIEHSKYTPESKHKKPNSHSQYFRLGLNFIF